MFSSQLFGTSGVRGEINKFLTPELVVKLSKAFAVFIGESGSIAVGRDVRLHSYMLFEACIAGLLSGGVDVVDCGVIPTPALLHVVKSYKLDGAVMITASHVPPRFGGVLFFHGDTAELTRREGDLLASLMFKGLDTSSNGHGKVTSMNVEDVSEIYLKSICQLLDVDRIRGLGCRVVLDLCNSAQSSYLPFIAREFGCEVLCINDFPNGYFPGRGADLHPSLLGVASRLISGVDADFALAVDGDGDRCLFIDEIGNVLWGDVAGCLFAREELLRRGGGVIVCPINTSNLILHVTRMFNGDVHFTKIGPPEIALAIKSVGDVVFSFEESGKYIWPGSILYGDPALALGKILEVLLKYDYLSRAVESFPSFHQVKYKVPCPDEIKGEVLEYVKNKISNFNFREIIDIDGLKIVFNDDSWLLLRPSGTEPVFRIFSESLDADYANELASIGLDIVREAIGKLSK